MSTASLLRLGAAAAVLCELDACRRLGRRWRLAGAVGRVQTRALRLGWLEPHAAPYGAGQITLTPAGKAAIERLRALLEPPRPTRHKKPRRADRAAPQRPRSPFTTTRSPHMPSMPVTKEELADVILQNTNCKKATAGRALEAILDHIAEAVAAGREVRLMGFGTFSRHTRPGSDNGRNPRTGERLTYGPTTRPQFKPGRRFSDRVATA